jgi:hypothetical protein
VREANRRETGFFDRFEIPAAAFDVQDVFFVSSRAALAKLDRSVAATVQNQCVVAAEELRRIHAQTEVSLVLGRFGVVPERFHGAVNAPALAGEA